MHDNPRYVLTMKNKNVPRLLSGSVRARKGKKKKGEKKSTVARSTKGRRDVKGKKNCWLNVGASEI